MHLCASKLCVRLLKVIGSIYYLTFSKIKSLNLAKPRYNHEHHHIFGLCWSSTLKFIFESLLLVSWIYNKGLPWLLSLSQWENSRIKQIYEIWGIIGKWMQMCATVIYLIRIAYLTYSLRNIQFYVGHGTTPKWLFSGNEYKINEFSFTPMYNS